MENGTAATEGEGFLSRMALNDNKAGMEGLDRDKINKIIMESSKGSKFYENELKREHQVNQRIEKMMLQKAHITDQQLKRAQDQVERTASELEKSRDLSRVIAHVDMDAFYAAVEMRDCPDLKDKPMAVGSMSMLSTSNYYARKYGVRAAMPGFIAKKLCPHLVIVPCNFDKYKSVSNEIREIFADYDPQFQPMSLDEAYLDFTEHLELRKSWPEASRTHRYRSSSTEIGGEQPEHQEESEVKGFSPVLFEESPSSISEAAATGKAVEVFGTSVEEAVREMRFRIEQKTMLTASAGIAPNMMLAKVCSDKNKPNGQYRLASTREAVMDFIQNLPVRKVSGIGKVSEKLLKGLDISSCAHLGQQMAMLSLLFSETAWHHFMQVSLGLGSTHIVRNEGRKSMSTERTFKELSRPDEQLSVCRELCEDLAQDMKREDLKGKGITLKLKNVNFEVKTRASTLHCAIATADEIFAVAKDLLKTETEHESPQPLRLRLMGVRISAFVSPNDKKPLQKSIVGFLQSEKAESQGSTQEVRQQFDGDRLSSCALTGQTCLTKEEIKKKGLLEDQPLSFFQRAYAKRLQLQVCTRERPNKETASVVALRDDDDDHKGAGSPTKCVGPKSAASHLSESDAVCSSEARASTSSSALNCLTCPVCCSQVSTDHLNVFNSHIDRCLSKGELHILESKSHFNKDRKDSEGLGTEARDDRLNNQVNSNKHDEHHLTKDCRHAARLINGDKGTVTSYQTRACHNDGSVLVCPVCQLTQDTNDLTVFNRHVDLCLNQEVLHEMGTSPPVEVAKSNNVIDRSIPPPRQAGRGKSKRKDSPSYVPSKKAKGLGPHNTIDKFFR